SPPPCDLVENTRGCGSLRGRVAGADRSAARSIGAPGRRETWPYAGSVSPGVWARGWNLGSRPPHRAQNARRWRSAISCCKRRDGVLMENVTTVVHPLVQHKLTLMRDKTTSTKSFRQLLREISTLLCYEVTRDLSLDPVQIETPLMPMEAQILAGKNLVSAPILRAGMGLIEGMLDLVPSARVAHIGLYRDPDSLSAVEYYFKAPSDLSERLVIVVDPMLATGNTAVAAVDRLKEHGASEVRFVCL